MWRKILPWRSKRFGLEARNAMRVMHGIRKAMKEMAPKLDLAIAIGGNSVAVVEIARIMAVVINCQLEEIPPPHQTRFRAQVARWVDKMADRGEA